MNPSHWLILCIRKIQDNGIFIKKWPTVLGCDIAGDVIEVGENVTNVKKGDRVAAYVA